MARRFRGESEQTVDSKGRVSVPALFRRVIEACDPEWTEGLRPELVIVYGSEKRNHLECYTIEAIEEIDRRIDRMKKGSIERRMLERLYHGHSMPAQIVEDGRIVLPQKLRKKLDLEDKAFFIASGDHFQIWKPSTYEETEMAKVDAWLDAQDEDFDPSSLLPDLPAE
ncbi:division/cell wall cluster transcriptional repressor MraZ [Pararhodobacter sp.]|uniref:division/cell wall cluster transcriptional repressor MraZ n=1 Tax=Pararhodobacter sp. TaxID=2127056 RepID=UPI002AFEAAD4|nr:division/cell wall cluster transcriptional repressor MraZ [Pararhodobacter sp.]